MIYILTLKNFDMIKEEKELLIRDLCGRLPYGVQGITSEGVISPLITKGEADWDILTSLNYRIVKHGWKPYLRLMSSMNSKEWMEYCDACVEDEKSWVWAGKEYRFTPVTHREEFLNSHYFDYRGLISMGLALEAPEGMYNTKTE